MKTKEKELLALLYQSRGSFISSKELALRLDLSERTVRTYIKRLGPLAVQEGASIEAKQGSGFRLVIHPGSSIDSMISENKLANIAKPYAIDNVQGRRDYIFQKLLLEGESPDQFDLADQLFVSESTIKKDLASLRPILRNYELQLEQNEMGGLQIQGEEQKKRALIMDYFFRNSKFDSLREFVDGSGYFEDVSSEALLMLIIDETRKENLQLSDVMIQNIMIHLALCIRRVKYGFKLDAINQSLDHPHSREARAAKAMMERLSRATSLSFTPEETDYLTLHLFSRVKKDPDAQNSESLSLEVQAVLEHIAQNSPWDFSDDQLLETALIDHLVPMLTRLKCQINQTNPLTQSIQNDRPEIFELVKREFSLMPSLKGLSISNDEWAYLALHVMAAVERADEKKKLQVLVICATGYGSSQLLHSRLMKHFSNSMHIVSETGYFSINDALLEGVDLIISTVNLGSVIFGVPFLHVSVFLSDEDIAAINAFIEKRRPSSAPKVRNVNSAFQNEVFHRYFDRSRFLIFDPSYNADQIMDTLIDLLAKDEKTGFKTSMKDQISLRSKMGNVAFSNTVVVSHPAVPLAKKAAFAIGIIPEGVYWDAAHPAVKFFMLMSPSFQDNDGLKNITMAIVSFLEEEGRQKNLLNNPTFEQFEIVFKPLIEE